MSKKVEAIPHPQNAITPHLIIKGAAQAIEFYKSAFGAVEVCRMPSPDGRVGHAEVKIGNSHVFLADEFPEMGGHSPVKYGGSPVCLHLYVDDVDTVFQRATQNGAVGKMPPTNMFWGDRYSKVTDPFGHEWSIATHIEDLTPEEMAKRSAEAFAGAPGKA